MTAETITVTARSEAETVALAARLALALRPGDVVALSGALGAGKTCFVRGLARGLGLDERLVSSPTFVICQEYERAAADGAPALVLAHLDGYRLGSPDELDDVGWDALLADPATIVVVEWPERFGARLPRERIEVRFEHAGDAERRLEWRLPADRAPAVDLEPARPCPICGKPARGDARPFCSSRCRLVDLGRWLGGGYVTSRDFAAEDFE